MIQVIIRTVRAIQRKRLVSAILERMPSLVTLEADDVIFQYITQAMQVHHELVITYEQNCQATLPGDPMPPEPGYTDLLLRCVAYWADRAAQVYALMLLEKEIDLSIMKQELDRYKQIEALRQKQEGLYGQVVEEAARLVKQANQAMEDASQDAQADRRLN